MDKCDTISPKRLITLKIAFIMKHFLFLFPALCLLACRTFDYPRYDAAAATGGERPSITTSLFDFKERSISEADIQRILDGTIRPPDTLRVAVYKYFGRVTRRYSAGFEWADEERLKTDQQMLDSLIGQIRRSKRVQKVIILPVMVTGFQPNVHQLREAAVRLQADMALIFSLDSDLYARYRTFKKDDAKAYATCEAVLMDIRTGVIPHSSVVTREAYGKKETQDTTLDEMRHRVQNTAVAAAIVETGRGVANYLEAKQ